MEFECFLLTAADNNNNQRLKICLSGSDTILQTQMSFSDVLDYLRLTHQVTMMPDLWLS